MSYDISLVDPVTRETLTMDAPHQMRGGTYAIGGTDEMWVNITYNYARWYYKDYAFGENGIRSIYGLSGAESIPVLKRLLKVLKTPMRSCPTRKPNSALSRARPAIGCPPGRTL